MIGKKFWGGNWSEVTLLVLATIGSIFVVKGLEIEIFSFGGIFGILLFVIVMTGVTMLGVDYAKG